MPNWNFRGVFTTYISLLTPYGSAKLRWDGGGDNILIKKKKTKIGRRYGLKNGPKKGRIRRRKTAPTRRIRREE